MSKTNAESVAQSLTPAVNALLIAKVNAELTRERINPVAREVLADFDYRVNLNTRCKGHGDRITDPDQLYLTTSDTAPYYAAMHLRYLAMGYDVQEGYCPALIAEDEVREAERALVGFAESFFPGCTADALLCSGLDNYKKFIDLTIGLVVNRPGYRNPLTG